MNAADMELTPIRASCHSRQTPAGQRAVIATLLRLLRDLPDVESAAAAMNAPYGSSSWSSSVSVGGRTYDFGANEANDTFAETMQLHRHARALVRHGPTTALRGEPIGDQRAPGS